MTEWTGRTAVEIASAVRGGRATAADVTRQHLDRIARLDPDLSAFRHVRAEQAMAEAEAVDRRADRASLPLAGVPVAVKDNIAVAGEQARSGSAATSPDRSAGDHVIVERLRAAGAVVVGLTNVPELCLVPMADSVYGIARNPWNEQRTPGGSSGGSAAAVAAGLVPLAHGNDGFGSIRIPCACCGTIGIKPGRGVVPHAPDDPTWFDLVENGPIATTVQDAALGLAVMADEPGFAKLGEVGALHIGVSVRPVSPGFPIAARYRRAALETGTLLQGLGHTVTRHMRRYPAWLGPASLSSWYASARASAAGLDRAGLDRSTRRLTAIGGALAAVHLDGAHGRDRWRSAAAERFFGQIDVLLLPALSQPAPRAERWGDRGGLRTSAVSTRTASLFGSWNIAGWPALAVPVGVDADAMPVAVQLVAKPGGEKLLLELAAQIEAVRPWPRHAPRYAAHSDGNRKP
ncbi:amidase [Streptomyces sp. JH14]|uniref:amidase n=1 Tax=Streptomyces sp. JH14 TaxID=2793630 RepID=UPI0023F6BCC0|nr:amidase family protein [Streptomyces sp. JH14]MDF6042668.1 amidase [Streptomyces sp. JH14]